MSAVLLTGATGFVGRELLTRYLERTDTPVFALVRAPDARAAQARLRETLAEAVGSDAACSDRVRAVPGDVQAPDLGLAPAARDELAARVTQIVHAAASVSFTLPLDESRAINVEGTRNVLDFAHRCDRLRRLTYISTAYVAGTHAGEFAEDDLDVGQDFRNAYERSKFEAEQLVRDRSSRLPIQVLRPSIVVGERGSGWTGSFNVLYSPLKAFARGALPAMPARADAPVDVVPVDYVADAVFELGGGPPQDDRTFHLVAGEQATTVRRLVELSGERLRRRRPRMLSPALYRAAVHPLLVATSGAPRRRALRRMKVFFPYFSMRVSYSNRHARRRLEPAGIRMTPVDSYFGRLLDFALRARWGRTPVTRTQARREAASRR